MPHSPISCLRRITIFKNIPTATLNKLAKISTHQVHYKKGEFIVTPETSNQLIAIDQGRAKVYTLSKDGKEKILYIADQGSINGQDNLFNGQKLTRYMQATEDSLVCSIKHDDFQNFLRTTPEVALSLLNSIGSRLINLEVNTSRRDLLKSKDRIYSYLLDWCKEAEDDEFTLPIKKAEFASMLGITPETLSRQLKQLVTSGKILMNGKKITMLKKPS